MKLLELLIFINSVHGRREDGKPEVQGSTSPVVSLVAYTWGHSWAHKITPLN